MMSRESKKHDKVMLLVKFYKEFGREPKTKEEYEGVKIGSFLNNIRTNQIRIQDEYINYLRDLGIRVTSKNSQKLVHEKVIALVEFYKEFGREPKEREKYKGINLRDFLKKIRKGNYKISEEDSLVLEELKIKCTKIDKEEEKQKKLSLLEEFYKEYGREPKTREEYKGVKIGAFLGRIRRGETKISEEDKKKLETLEEKYPKKTVKELVHEKVVLLIEFYEKYGREPKQNEKYKEIKLGIFLANIRSGNTKMSIEDIEILENIGIKTNRVTKKEKIHKNVILLKEFYEKFGRLPKVKEQYKDTDIGSFLGNIRSVSDEISEEDKICLEKLGIEYNSTMIKSRTHEKLMLVVEFYEKFGKEPRCKEKYKGVNIGAFMVNVRTGNTELSENDKNLLEQLGIRCKGKKVLHERIHKNAMLVAEFYRKFGREPKFTEEYKKNKLGFFLSDIRKGKIKILEKDRKYLQDLGIKL